MRSVKARLDDKKGNFEVLSYKFEKKKQNAESRMYLQAIQKIILHGHHEKTFFDKMKRVLGEYLIDKAVERATINTEDKNVNRSALLFKILDSAVDVSMKNNRLNKEVVNLMRKCVILYMIGVGINRQLVEEKMQNIANHLLNTDLQKPKHYLALMDIKQKPEEYLKDLLFNADLSSDSYQYNVSTLPKLQQTILFNPYYLDPSIIEMPKNYLDFISIYFRETCVICKSIPIHG